MTERSRGKRWNGANMKRKKLGSVSLDLVPGPDNPRNSEMGKFCMDTAVIRGTARRMKLRRIYVCCVPGMTEGPSGRRALF